ncbi:MAG TPA: chemotaxis protein CheW [Blastocatellia bacterium]|nr:chemotaxis protein CheW [Blastocatellia bacterium]
MAGEPDLDRNSLSGSLLIELNAGEGGEARPGTLSVLVFEVGDEKYAIGVDHTEGVVDCPRITPLPSPPDGMIGVTSVRGRVTLVLAPGSASGHREAKQRLILLKGDAQLGLIADRVEGVISLAPSRRRKPRSRAAKGASVPPEAKRETWPVLATFKQGKITVRIIDVERLVEA